MSPKSKSQKNHWEKAIDGILEHLASINYSEKTLSIFVGIYKKLLKFLRERDLISKIVSKTYTDDFLQYCSVPDNDSNQKCARSQQKYKHAMRILLEYQQNGRFDRMAKKMVSPLTSEFYQSLLTEDETYRTDILGFVAKRSLQDRLSTVRCFLEILIKSNIHRIDKIRSKHVNACILKNPNVTPDRIAHNASAIKAFFQFLISTNRALPKILDIIPRIRYSRTYRIPAIWSKESVHQLLSVIDRNTKKGKRDYAICLFVIHLGMRIGDVLSLRFENIDWRKAVVRFAQEKTKNSHELPLSEEIGEALIDYLQNGRQKSTLSNVFLTISAPYRPLGGFQDSMIDGYIAKAGIRFSDEGSHGFHSLRHGLATKLHEADTSFPVIAAIMGHSDLESTHHYAKTNIEMLRTAALEWKEFDNE